MGFGPNSPAQLTHTQLPGNFTRLPPVKIFCAIRCREDPQIPQSLFFSALWAVSSVNNFLEITGTSNYFEVVLKGV